MRSFGIVEFKLYESDFFLQKLQETRDSIDAEFYLSAFLNASRTVTLALQACLSDHPNFARWYEQQRVKLRQDSLAAWFLNARNASHHEGATFIHTTMFAQDNKSAQFFEGSFMDKGESIYDALARTLLEAHLGIDNQREYGVDMATRCKEHLTNLLRIIYDCFQTFGPAIDPDQYYTLENMRRLQKTVEDLEVELGFPSGWTAGLEEDRRLIALRQELGETEIDELFCKYLGVDRFGRKCESDLAQ